MKYAVPDTLQGRLVWRYLSLGRFIWLLQHKQLWLSRTDKLNDRWETLPSSAETERLMASAAPEVGTDKSPYKTQADALRGLVSVLGSFARHAFVNCWFDAPTESFGMWNTYGRSPESVAIQTTLGKLSASVPREDFEVLPIHYDYKMDPRILEPLYLATRKRGEFAYENEIRIIHLKDPRASTGEPPPGIAMPWEPAAFVEHIYVHPDADVVTVDTVVGLVRQLAPSLAGVVMRSELSQGPEAIFTPSMIKAMAESPSPVPRPQSESAPKETRER